MNPAIVGIILTLVFVTLEATQFVYVIARFDGVMAQRFGTSVVVEGADDSTIQRALDVVGRAGGFEPLET